MVKPHQNQMIVEGYEDLTSIVHLMRHHVDWPVAEAARPVHIRIAGSAEEILDRAFIQPTLKQTGLRRIGFMLDADASCQSRWDSMKALLAEHLENMPQQPSPGGYINTAVSGLRVGVWIMPDNQSPGMLESFLSHLVPTQQQSLWDYAKEAGRVAKTVGAPYVDAHLDKATIHTWLAWQEPPGERFGLALTKQLLNPSGPYAADFISWFRSLFELPPRSAPSVPPNAAI